MNKITKYILLFFIGGIFGGLLEIGYQIITRGDFVLGGFLYGPFRPIYGYGFLILYFIGKKVNKNPLFIFLVSFIVCSVFEYLVSYGLEKIFNATWWDYRDFYLNLNGRICIMVSLFWGLLGLLFIKIIIPSLEKLFDKLNKYFVCIFIFIASTIFITDTVLSFIRHLK